MAEYLSSEDSWRGRFWLPGQQDQDQRGILTYSPDNGVLLNLIGGFDDAVWSPATGSTQVLLERSREWPVIHGVVGREPVTLLDCVAARSKSYMLSGEVSEQEIRTSQALVGVLLKEPEGQLFSEVTIELENLTEWDHRSDVVFEIERDEKLPRGARWRIAVDPVDARVAEIGDFIVELKRWYRMPSHDVLSGRLEASTFAVSYFTVRSSEPRSVGEWMETAQVLQDLITLAMDAPCAVLKASLAPADELRADQESLARDEIAVYARHVVNGDPDAPGVEGGYALFTWGTEGVDFQTVLPRWFVVHQQFHATCDMILSLIYSNGGYLETQLITAVAAAEAMHEALDLTRPIPDDEFRALKKALMKCIPENRKLWLSEKLGSNRPTLRQRLMELSAVPDDDVMTRLLPDPVAWAEAAKKSRDLVAHGGKASRDVALMYAITEVTIAVVIVNVLYQLGIPRERMMYALTTTGRLTRAARLAGEHWPAVGPQDVDDEDNARR